MREYRQPIQLYPIGYVENEFTDPGDSRQAKFNESRIVIDPDLVTGLQGLEPGHSVMVLFHFDRVHDFELLQHPRGNSYNPKRGVFTIRSPRRPNFIGVTIVEIIAIEKSTLRVRGLDAFDGTPIIDLKPA